jgi:2'-5' RNA ligase
MLVKKYFIAIVIPEPGFSRIEHLKQSLYTQHGLKGALRSPAHITLHRPFEWRESKEGSLIDCLSQFEYEKNFSIQLQNFAFFEPRVVYIDVLPNTCLVELHDRLSRFVRRELKLYNESEDMRGFHPHVTVAFRDLKKPLFYDLKRTFTNQTFSFDFSEARMALLKLDKTWQVIHLF